MSIAGLVVMNVEANVCPCTGSGGRAGVEGACGAGTGRACAEDGAQWALCSIAYRGLQQRTHGEAGTLARPGQRATAAPAGCCRVSDGESSKSVFAIMMIIYSNPDNIYLFIAVSHIVHRLLFFQFLDIIYEIHHLIHSSSHIRCPLSSSQNS